MGRRFFSRPEDVEDYVQEVFLRAYEKLNSFSGAADTGELPAVGADSAAAAGSSLTVSGSREKAAGQSSKTGGTLEAAGPSFAGWLYKLAYRHAINARRSHLRIRESFFGEIETAGPDRPEDEVVRMDTIDRVQAELSRLPGLYLMLIRMKYYEGFTFSRMSDITGMPEGTLKSHLHRCRKVLKKSLQRFEGSEE